MHYATARPEGCIAECYLADECVRFCSMYMKKAADIGIPQCRNEEFEDETILEGRPISKGKPLTLSDDMLKIAHRYVLFNSGEVNPYIEMHLDELKHSDRILSHDDTLLQKRHIETFVAWFANKIKVQSSITNVSKTLKWLSIEPRRYALSYSGYIINGKRFHISSLERSTQDSGVFLEAETICRSSAKDTSHVVANVSYYGVIKDIILLDFHMFRLPIFQCDWANIVNGVKVDDGFTLVNLHQGQNQLKNDPFILASQAKQVFYSRESKTSNWYVVLKAPPRGFHELEMYDENAYKSYAPVDVSELDINERDKDEPCVRIDCEGKLCDDE